MNDFARNLIILILMIINLFFMVSLGLSCALSAVNGILDGHDKTDILMLLIWTTVASIGHGYIAWNLMKFATCFTGSRGEVGKWVGTN